MMDKKEMPYKMVANKKGGWDIIDKSGQVVGHAESMEKAKEMMMKMEKEMMPGRD